MNGQENLQPPSVDRVSSAAASSGNASPAASAAVVSTSAWLKDTMMRAVQAGQLLPGQMDPATLAQNFPFSYPLVFPANSLPPIAQMADPSKVPSVLSGQQSQQMMSMPTAYYGDAMHAAAKDRAQPSGGKDAHAKHPSADAPTDHGEPSGKKRKIDAVHPSVSSAAAAGLAQPPAPGINPKTRNLPHRPEYFHKGSVIQLGDNKLKRLEDLVTADFETSSHLNPEVCLDCSVVTKIAVDPNRGTAFLSFSVGDQRQDQVDATAEATLEHPFFVYNQGWSSVSPEKTLSFYRLRCQQLRVGDRCISLKFKDQAHSVPAPATAAAVHTSAINHAGPPKV